MEAKMTAEMGWRSVADGGDGQVPAASQNKPYTNMDPWLHDWWWQGEALCGGGSNSNSKPHGNGDKDGGQIWGSSGSGGNSGYGG